jgi:hypothetical protein
LGLVWLATLLITASVLASMGFRQRFKGSTWEIVLPLIAPSLLGVGLLTFTLSYDEFTRTSLVSGQNNTLPLEILTPPPPDAPASSQSGTQERHRGHSTRSDPAPGS